MLQTNGFCYRIGELNTIVIETDNYTNIKFTKFGQFI